MRGAPRRRWLHRARLGWTAIAAWAAACTPLYLPPVPSDVLVAAPAWRLAGETRLEVVGDVAGRATGLRLRLRFDEVPGSAWVALQWFGPTGGERASDARWIEPHDAGRELVWDTPDDLMPTSGRWRAVLSVGDRLLRQVDVEVASPPP